MWVRPSSDISLHTPRTMKYVLTLIGNPAENALSAAVADKIGAAMARAGAMTAAIDWLGKRRAVDIAFDDFSPARALAIACDTIDDLPIDLHAQPISGRRKQLLMADMDSTIVEVETIDELASHVGKRDEVAAITAAAMAGKLDYAESLRARTKLFAGIPEEVLERVYAEQITLTPGARELIATMKTFGITTLLVSGGFTYFVDRVAADLGFDAQHANRLKLAGGVLTGALYEPILGAQAKRDILETAVQERGIAPNETMAVGDGANDIAMLDGAGIGIAYHAKPVLAERADVRINYTDLRTLLYLQGIRDSEIIEPEAGESIDTMETSEGA